MVAYELQMCFRGNIYLDAWKLALILNGLLLVVIQVHLD